MTLRQFVSSNPMTIPAVALTIGSWQSAMGTAFTPWLALAIATGLTPVLIVLVQRFMRRNTHLGIVTLPCIAILCLCIGYGNSEMRKTPYIDAEGPTQITGHITKVIRNEANRMTLELQADTLLTGSEVYTGLKGILVVHRGLPGIRPGMQATLGGLMSEPHSHIFSDFDYAAHLRSNGESFYVTCDSLTQLTAESQGHWRHRYMGFCQQYIDNRLQESGVSEKNRGFLRALLIGDKSVLSPEMRETFVDCGTAHILAVSGMHVGIIYGILSVVLRLLFRVPKQRCAAIASLILWGYAIMVGMPPSVMRAVIMFTIVAASGLIGRHPSLAQELSVALFVIVLIEPQSVTSAGLWLSFSAVSGILCCTETIEAHTYRMSRWASAACQSTVVCLAAQMATLPITLYAFHKFPTYFLINNLIILPTIAPIVMLSLTCVATSWIPGLSWLLGHATNYAIDIVSGYATWAAGLPLATIDHIPFSTADLIGLTLLSVSVFGLVRETTRPMAHLANLSGIAFLAILAAENWQHTTQKSIDIASCSGNLNIAITDGLRTHLLMSDTAHTLSHEAMEHTLRDMRTNITKITPIGQSATITTATDTIEIVRTPHKELTNANIYIIDCDRAPQPNDKQDATYYVTSNCHFELAWAKRQKKCIILKRNDKMTVQTTQ